MNAPRNGHRIARPQSAPVRASVLLVALTAALLAAALSSGGSTTTPERALVARLPEGVRAADLTRISARAQAAGADSVVLVPPQNAAPPPYLLVRQSAWTPDAGLARRIAVMDPPAVVSLTEVSDLRDMARGLSRSVEAVDEKGTVLRAADTPEGRQGMSPLRAMGLLAAGLLAMPTARALVRHAGRPSTARQHDQAGVRVVDPPRLPSYGPTAGPSSVHEAAVRVPEPEPDRELPPSGAGPPPPVAFDIVDFEARMTGGPESGPQCPRCGSFDVSENSAGTTVRCAHCPFQWGPDPLGRPPQLLIEPERFPRGIGEHGGET